MTQYPNTRVNVYIDGFNVYYGFKRKGWERFLWLDYRSVMERICQDHHILGEVMYFTALSRDDASRGRQQTYLEALDIRGGLTVRMGRLERRPRKCKGCGATRCPECGERWYRDQEKESDVALATELLSDAFMNTADEFWVVSRDADLAPAVRYVANELKLKVLVIRPPNGTGDRAGGDALVQAAGGHGFWIRDQYWKQCQLPEVMQRAPGHPRKRRPPEWS